LEELQLILTPSRVDQRKHGVMSNNWRVGQTISALVSERMPNGSAILTLGGHKFATSLDLPVQPGSLVRLEVKQVEPRFILKVLDAASSALPSREVGSPGASSPVFIGDRTHHHGVSQLYTLLKDKSLAKLINGSFERSELLAMLSRNSLTSTTINANTFRLSFLLSGIFTESLWRASRSDLAVRSTKTMLLTLRERLTNMLTSTNLNSNDVTSLQRFLSGINDALASTTNKQLASIAQDNGQLKWVTSIPLELGDNVEELDVEVEHQREQVDTNLSPWQLKFSLTLNALGHVAVSVTSLGGRCSIELSVDPKVEGQVSEAMPKLKSQLIMSGLQVDALNTKVKEVESTHLNDNMASSLDISV
jgi:hypothetical protein